MAIVFFLCGLPDTIHLKYRNSFLCPFKFPFLSNSFKTWLGPMPVLSKEYRHLYQICCSCLPWVHLLEFPYLKGISESLSLSNSQRDPRLPWSRHIRLAQRLLPKLLRPYQQLQEQHWVGRTTRLTGRVGKKVSGCGWGCNGSLTIPRAGHPWYHNHFHLSNDCHIISTKWWLPGSMGQMRSRTVRERMLVKAKLFSIMEKGNWETNSG